MKEYILPIVSTSIVVLAAVWCWLYIRKKKAKNELEKKRRWVEQLPSLVSTIGVFGTFVGITIGLINFDTDDIAGSIPELLSGLSTAFFTSLAGMLGSMILSRQVNALFDEEEKGISDARACF